ncbi:MAG: hypothetical protein JSW28_01720, partial [Thermoplasmata archaeon]
KFGEEPPMYAFYPIHDEKGTPSYFTVPELKGNYRLKLLGRYEVKDGNFVFPEVAIPCDEASEAVLALSDGRHEVAEVVSRIAEENDLDQREARGLLEDIAGKLIVAKEMTIHT